MEYLIKASVITALFYLCYKLFLQRETFFESNRWFLFIGVLVTVGLPLLVIPIYIEASQHAFDISAFTETGGSITTVTDSDYTFNILSSMYLLGVSFFLIKLVLECTSLFRLLKNKKTEAINGFQIIETEAATSPFSFFNFIVYNAKQFSATELTHIINHEKVHAKHLHSIDIILIQLATVIFWFNPFIWFYKKEMQQNLEFIADKNAQRISSCKKSYAYVLLKTTVSNPQLKLTNNFYTSLIKKRIVMLHKSKSNKLNLLKYAFILPLLALFLMSFNTKEVYLNGNAFHSTQTTEAIETVLINKDFTDAALDKITSEFKSKDVTLDFKSIKRNNNNEIIAIKIEASSKKTKTKFSSNSNNAIKPIKITYNSEDYSISISTIEDEEIFITEDGKTKIVKSGSGSNVIILTEEEKNANHNMEVIVEDENNKDHKVIVQRKATIIDLNTDASENKEKVLFITKDKDGNIITEDIKQGKESKTWVVEEGAANDIKIITQDKDGNIIKDGKNFKNKKKVYSFTSNKSLSPNSKHMIIQTKEKNGNIISEDIIIEGDKETIWHTDNNEEQDVKFIKSNIGNSLFISTDAENSPLIFIDDKESTREELENLDPNNIASMNVIKGEKHTRKYGEKAKNGVIQVTTKK
ncbi:M56 family metallopeptidase [Lacinutrix himadriensis]|uniref:M56 family metallopeptidase n=1 Tax=Lacinutrix himadriensis TaxID=641549 RepID=UPI0006E25608|nr:M56 family metallopeptidase [Lacinutrix himadriensis]